MQLQQLPDKLHCRRDTYHNTVSKHYRTQLDTGYLANSEQTNAAQARGLVHLLYRHLHTLPTLVENGLPSEAQSTEFITRFANIGFQCPDTNSAW